MTRRALFLAASLAAVVACERHAVAPNAVGSGPSFAKTAETGPPPSHNFGPDTRETGVFTGQNVPGQPRLVCSAGGTQFNGYLESDVDGTLLDARLELPTTSGPHPLVVLLHGWAGSKGGSGDIASSLLAEGYAVLRYSARGFGDSWGRVNLSDIGVEIGDLRSVISRVVEQPDCALRADAVAITGTSYGGGQSWLAAIQPVFRQSPDRPEIRIRTIVPIVPWTDLLYSLVPNGEPRNSIGVPGALKFSYVNALFFSGQREPGEGPEPWYDNYPLYLRQWHASLSTLEPIFNPLYPQARDGLAGYRSIWWQQDFWTTVAATRLPIFQIQGFTDDLFTLEEAKRMLLALKSVDPSYPIASYFGDIGHPRARNAPAEVEYVLGLVRSWLAYYLKGDGGPPAPVIYAAVTGHAGDSFDQGDVITVATYEELASDVLTQKFKEPAVLVNPASGAPSGPISDPLLEAGLVAAGELKPLPGQAPEPATIDPTVGTYRVPVAELTGGSPLLIAGQPTVSLSAATSSRRVQLNVRLYDVAPTGTKELITRGTYTTDESLRDPLTREIKITIPTAGNLWRVPADHVLQLEISNNDFPYLSPSQLPSVTAISKVELSIPRR